MLLFFFAVKKITEHSSAVTHFKDNVNQIVNSINKIKEDISEIKGSVKPLENRIEKIKEYISEIKGSVKPLENRIEKIKEDISEIKGSVKPLENRIEKLETVSNKFSQSNSPIGLTKDGEKRKKEIYAEKIIANHWDKIKNTLDNEINKDTNPYDIQVKCFEYANKFQDFITKDELENIKSVAFKNGDTVSDYWIIFGIIIRNKYLEIFNIPIDTIDKHKPDKK